MQRAKYQMRLHVESTLSVNSLAKKMNLSASRLNEIFKKYTSMTPYQYFIDIKINKAKALLEQKDVSVKETAFRLGFDDPYHFSRLFKNKTGRSPLRYQQHILAME